MTTIEYSRTDDGVVIPYFFSLERYDQLRALESLLFASDEPLTVKMLDRLLVQEDPSQSFEGQQTLPLDENVATPLVEVARFEIPNGFFDTMIDEVNLDLEKSDRPYRVVKVAGGFQFATTPQHGQLVQRLLKAKNRRRLTQAALETLAIVAYRQPITKPEVDAIRGVNASEVVNSLVEKELLMMVGRSETPGKPLLYGTTAEFLRVFGLNTLSDLPKLREIDDLISTTTTMIEMDDSISITTDRKELRRQLAILLDDGTQVVESVYESEVQTDEVGQEPEIIEVQDASDDQIQAPSEPMTEANEYGEPPESNSELD
ncbi:MAG: SMC-Scp complex subunit ScpB [Ignavibacteria bacterium]|nr:SMC-Scp complex subunit ScpB [Ignavibacteria bacterium]